MVASAHMSIVTARTAGVRRVIACTPPNQGEPHAETIAAMALITAATEPEHEIIAFSAQERGGYGGMHGGGEPGITRVNLSPRMRLADVIQHIEAIPMGGTDCALPMLWAARNKLNVAGFITCTDSETWAGKIHHGFQGSV